MVGNVSWGGAKGYIDELCTFVRRTILAVIV